MHTEQTKKRAVDSYYNACAESDHISSDSALSVQLCHSPGFCCFCFSSSPLTYDSMHNMSFYHPY